MFKPSKVLKNVKYPKINNPPMYEAFIKNFLAMPGNRKIFPTMDKSTIDAEYERQLQADSRLSDSGVTRYLEECRGKTGQSVWDHHSEQHFNSRPGTAAESGISENVRSMNLPQVLTPTKGYSNRFSYELLHYAHVAAKLEKVNPGVDFDKDRMDEAFTAALLGVGAGKSKGSGHDSKPLEVMMKRCLGRESDLYWKSK